MIDPRKIGLVDYADIWLRPKLGTNVAVLNGLMNVIIEEDLYAKEYVAGRTEGFDTMRKAVAK
ncbi:MAG: molybdopterin-dependent oxidoreductase, partial [Deltaproteobacteria bacterium]|nr:molybdopterin-dependent oxidoreductase [Deltaproteobacteria bacterium]